ncbi:MAG: lipoprotein-releasing ABC transporter permease subunit [Deltaproteobacteria bacterium]|nr:lipoprotein-releasing ABC transporter permease subunit [Deltaproteobacteria bacterium]
MSFEWFISQRYLKSKQKQSFISMITVLSAVGIMIGVMTLIIVIAVMSGAESDLKTRIAGIDSHIIIMRYNGPFADYHPVLKTIKNFKDIKSASPFVYSQMMLRSASGASGVIVRGIDPHLSQMVIKDAKSRSLKNCLIHTEKQPSKGRLPRIILGKELAKNLKAAKGDRVFLISPGTANSAMTHIPGMRPFEVAGIFSSGMFEYDKSLVYLHITDAQKLLGMDDAVTGIEAGVTDIFKAGEIAEKIVTTLGFPYWARDWKAMNRNLFISLKLQKVVMFIILALIVLVAAFNITAALIMMVMEKMRDISILKAMGATNQSIKKIFVFKGMLIGLTGTLLGTALGLCVCTLLKRYKFIELPNDVYYFSSLPVQIEPLDLFIIGSVTLAICLLATLYPAGYASRMNPVDGIRYG